MAQTPYGNSNYAPQMPSSQGPNGSQGASGISTPEQIGAQQYRASMYQPPPSSTQQPSNGQEPKQTGQSMMTQQQSYGSGGGGSPVMSNGMISSQSSTTAPQQPPTTGASQSQPQGADPFAAMGGGVWTGQQWVPKDHPLAQQAQQNGTAQGQGPAAPTGAQPTPANYSPYGAYPGRPDGTTYQAGQLPQYQFQNYQPSQFAPIQTQQMPTYQAGQIGQFQAPDQTAQTAQQNQLMQQIAANPGWGADAVNQMKAAQKDTALSMQQQQQQALQSDAVGRGMLNSGQTLGNERRLGDATQQNILGAYRDIDTQNAQNTYQNQLSALSAQNDVLNSQANRASSLYNTGLAGQQAQQQANQAQAQSGQNAASFGLQQALAQNSVQQSQADENNRAYQNQFTAPAFQQQTALAQQQLNQQGAASGLASYNTDLNAFQNYQNNQNTNRQLDIQSQLGNAGIGVDQAKLNEQTSEFGQSNQLNWAQLLNNMYLGRANLGLDYTSLQQQSQNAMMQALFGSMLGS